jgi:methionine synthase I (cobalamin-dependent)
MGTELIGQGISPVDVMRANLTCPDAVRAIHRANIAAGAELITSNTFGPRSGRDWLDEFRAGVEIALETAAESEREIGIWVSMTSFVVTREIAALRTLFESTPVHPLLVLLETCTSMDEARQAASAAATLSPDVLAVTGHFGANGNMSDGTTPEAFATRLAGDGAQITGANCGERAEAFVEITARMRAVVDVPLLIQPSAGLPQLDSSGQWVYPMTTDEFAQLTVRLVNVGADMIGGCCGTTPAHIAAARNVPVPIGRARSSIAE